MTSWRKSSMLKSRVLILIIHATFTSFVQTVDRTNEFLNNLQLTHWNSLKINTTCPTNLFITALKLRTVVYDGVTSVNSIQVTCSDEIDRRNKASRSASLGHPTGEWGQLKRCKGGFAVGVSAVISPTPVSSPSSALQSLKIYCSDDPTVIRDGGAQGYDTTGQLSKEQVQFCDTGDALIGLTMTGDSIITVQKGDTSSVKGIHIQCKPVSNPVNHRNIDFQWEKRHGMLCNDSQIPWMSNLPPTGNSSKDTFSITCSYLSWTGIGLNSNLRRTKQALDAYGSMGLNNNKDFVKWALLRRLMSMDTRRWFLKQFSDHPRLLDDFATEMLLYDAKNHTGTFHYTLKRRYPIPPNLFKTAPNNKLVLKFAANFEQFVGNCAIYQIAFAHFKAKHHVFIETRVNKRMTRIVFEEFDMEKMKVHK